MIKDCNIHPTAKIYEPVNLYGCTIGKNVMIGPFVEIQDGVSIGDNSHISSHSFICKGVTIEDSVFIAHGVMFINDTFNTDSIKNWKLNTTLIKGHARIGSNSTILPITVGNRAIVGAGSVVTKDVPDDVVVCGNPAKTHPIGVERNA